MSSTVPEGNYTYQHVLVDITNATFLCCRGEVLQVSDNLSVSFF